MTIYIILALIAVVLTGIAQVLLKKSSLTYNSGNIIKFYLNFINIIAYSIFVIATLLNTYAYKILPLKYGVIFLPLTYIMVGFFGRYFFKEQLSKKQTHGILIILLGIIIYNL